MPLFSAIFLLSPRIDPDMPIALAPTVWRWN